MGIGEISERIPYLGLDLEEVLLDHVKLEYNPNRLDLGIITGLVKAFKGITGQEMGIIKYHARKDDYKLLVDEFVGEVRPFVVSAVVKEIPMDEETLKEVIALQEDLHETIGRKRRKVSIGIHNLDVVTFPTHYRGLRGEEARFRPLGETEEMTLSEVLEWTEKGKEYAHIIEGKGRYPVIMDDAGEVLSLPPIINSEYTRIDPGTRNFFIDITGTDFKAIDDSLKILTTSLADFGGEIWSVSVEGPYNMVSPDLSSREVKVDVATVKTLLGMELKEEGIIRSLRASRLDGRCEEGSLVAEIPPYRVDIMHPVDIVEEVAIGYGYWKIEPVLPEIYQMGERIPKKDFYSKVAEILVGAGFEEVMNFTLSSVEEQFQRMELEAKDNIGIKQPKSLGYEILRVWIIPDLLEVLRTSKKETYPQRIFEIGRTAKRTEDGISEEEHLGLAITHRDAGYTDVKSTLEAMTKLLEVEAKITSIEHPSFILGRVGRISIDEREVGTIGEISPQILENHQLDNPVACLEINLDILESLC